MFYCLHVGLRPQDIEAVGPIDLTIIWSVPQSICCVASKPRRPIMVVCKQAGVIVPTHVVGHTLTRRIREKQEMATQAMPEVQGQAGGCSPSQK